MVRWVVAPGVRGDFLRHGVVERAGRIATPADAVSVLRMATRRLRRGSPPLTATFDLVVDKLLADRAAMIQAAGVKHMVILLFACSSKNLRSTPLLHAVGCRVQALIPHMSLRDVSMIVSSFASLRRAPRDLCTAMFQRVGDFPLYAFRMKHVASLATAAVRTQTPAVLPFLLRKALRSAAEFPFHGR
eukprot:Sspe_Gene.5825::Locus_1940_Transcript_1_1_Confidence_1.000_Length_1651::g.5825::m.5825